MEIGDYIYEIVFFLIASIPLVSFVIFLILSIATRAEKSIRKVVFIIFSVISGILTFSEAALIIMLFIAVQHM